MLPFMKLMIIKTLEEARFNVPLATGRVVLGHHDHAILGILERLLIQMLMMMPLRYGCWFGFCWCAARHIRCLFCAAASVER